MSAEQAMQARRTASGTARALMIPELQTSVLLSFATAAELLPCRAVVAFHASPFAPPPDYVLWLQLLLRTLSQPWRSE